MDGLAMFRSTVSHCTLYNGIPNSIKLRTYLVKSALDLSVPHYVATFIQVCWICVLFITSGYVTRRPTLQHNYGAWLPTCRYLILTVSSHSFAPFGLFIIYYYFSYDLVVSQFIPRPGLPYGACCIFDDLGEYPADFSAPNGILNGAR